MHLFLPYLLNDSQTITAPKAAPSGKELISIFIQTNSKRLTSMQAIC